MSTTFQCDLTLRDADEGQLHTVEGSAIALPDDGDGALIAYAANFVVQAARDLWSHHHDASGQPTSKAGELAFKLLTDLSDTLRTMAEDLPL